MDRFDRLQRAQARIDAEPDGHAASQDQAYKLTAICLEEFLAKELPPREPLLEPILSRQGLMMIHGPRGIAKTFVALNIAYAVASGGSYLNWRAPRPHGVLYVDGEMPASTLQERLRSISSGMELEARLLIVTPDLNRETGMPDLATCDGQQKIDALIADDIELLIIDNLSCLCRSGKENEAESWQPVQEWALRHRAAGRSVIFVHHSGKRGQQRGTSRREDVLDTVIGLKRPAGYSPTEGARFECHIEKGRGVHGQDAAPFLARLEISSTGEQAWSIEDVAPSLDREILELANEGKTDREIAEILGINRSTAYRHRIAARGKTK